VPRVPRADLRGTVRRRVVHDHHSEVVDDACRDVGRDPADIERTVAVLVGLPGGTGRLSGNESHAAIPPVTGDPAAMAEALRGYARAGIGTVQLVLDPITVPSIQAVAKALAELDRG